MWRFWVAANGVIVLRRPVVHVMGVLVHREGGPAIRWLDGESYYVLRGVNVPEHLANTPANELNPSIILTERNVEVRREIVHKIGLERILEHFGAECVDAQGDYELLMLRFDDWRRPFSR